VVLSHFADMSWFAVIISVVLAVMSRRGLRERVKYTILSVLAFVLIAVAIGWLLFPFSH
jgi:uncharacterized membrane protein YqgA involved in biofilm formation